MSSIKDVRRKTTMSSREDVEKQRDVANKKRKVRKQLKNNRKPKRPRRKGWMPDGWDDLDTLHDIDYPQSERIMPRGERERRREIEAAVLAALDAEETEAHGPEELRKETTPGQTGVVVEVSSSLCRVALNGRSLICGLRGSLSAKDTGFTNVVAVGDRVTVSLDGSDRGVVESVLPRQNILARHDVFYTHLQQVLVANADQLLIVASWREPHLWPELVDRYLIAAERNDLLPLICVNKIDLADDLAACRGTLQPYLDLGYHILYTSTVTREGIPELKQALQGRTTVLAGLSGVGKSSLLNAIQPSLQIHTQEVSDYSYQGRHTTAQASMKELEIGGFVVDTPGIREFGLGGLQPAELVRFYPEIAAVADRCRFPDCSHTHEPDCAVKTAVEQGQVSAMRYHSYGCIYDSLGKL
jgi:ribosome biogenesis GTPase